MGEATRILRRFPRRSTALRELCFFLHAFVQARVSRRAYQPSVWPRSTLIRRQTYWNR